MDLQAILLLILAGVIHAAWNLLSKKSVDKQAFLCLAVVAATLLFLPLFLLLYAPFPGLGWAYILISGALEAVYFVLLGGAYQRGDLSLVYPLARGSAPLFVAFFAVSFLEERLTTGGIAGIALIVAGIYMLHLKSLNWRGLYLPLLSLRDRPSQLALLTGVTIAAYSVVDKVGVRYVNPFLYAYLIFVVAALLFAPYMLVARPAALKAEWRVGRNAILAVALMFAAPYLLILFAMTTSKVSYVSSVREISVVFGALLGAFLLREPFGRTKFLGSLLIFAGIICIALAKQG